MNTLPSAPGGAVPMLTAVYRRSSIEEFRGNPLIEALPPIPSEDGWLDRLENFPKFDGTIRAASSEVRTHYIMRLRDFFESLPGRSELAGRIDMILRQGYKDRNPATAARGELLQKLYENGQKSGVSCVQYSDSVPISTFSLVAPSGMGKTVTTERILGAYPQLLYHPDSGLVQLTWLKINCPHNGDLTQLYIDTLAEFDRVLGTEYSAEFEGQASERKLAIRVKQLATAYSLGLLVIDELHNLVVKQSENRQVMLNFFKELSSTLKIPLMLIGTPKALSLHGIDFQQARRDAALGWFGWQPMKNDDAWEMLLESLWDYQWVRHPVRLSTDMRDMLHTETQGILSVVTAAFMFAQLRAIRTGEETLSPALFERVMRKDFQLLQPMLRALRSRDPAKIAKYPDIDPVFFHDLLEHERFLISAKALKSRRKSRTNVPESEKARALETLATMEYAPEKVEPLIDEMIRLGADKSPKIVKGVLNKLLENEPLSPEDPQDLRGSSVEALASAGVIKGIE